MNALFVLCDICGRQQCAPPCTRRSAAVQPVLIPVQRTRPVFCHRAITDVFRNVCRAGNVPFATAALFPPLVLSLLSHYTNVNVSHGKTEATYQVPVYSYT